jgi:hypothetical protein
MYDPVVVRESAPMTTPLSNLTAMIEVCTCVSLWNAAARSVDWEATYTEVDLALLEALNVDKVDVAHGNKRGSGSGERERERKGGIEKPSVTVALSRFRRWLQLLSLSLLLLQLQLNVLGG